MSGQRTFSVEGISFSYTGERPVCSDIFFSMDKGERLGLIGPNGSGKTTLMMLLCGVLKPSSGEILFHGRKREAGSFDPEITYLFQSPDDQLFCSTVKDDVAFGPLNMGLSREDVEKSAGDALELVGCKGLEERSPHHLSGGEKRLVAVATLLAMNPELLLFDEPESSLDGRNRRLLINLVHKLPATLLIASHDLEFLLETCTRVLLLDGGEIRADGAIREILSDEELLLHHGLEKPHSLIPHSGSGHVHLASRGEADDDPTEN